MHLPPLSPQKTSPVPVWQMPLESQQPLQFDALQSGGFVTTSPCASAFPSGDASTVASALASSGTNVESSTSSAVRLHAAMTSVAMKMDRTASQMAARCANHHGQDGVMSQALMLTVPHFWIMHVPPLQSAFVAQAAGPLTHATVKRVKPPGWAPPFQQHALSLVES